VNTLVAGCILFIAQIVPYLSLVMSIVGALLTISISITIPTMASYNLHHNEMGLLEKLWAVTVIVIGLVCTASGTASALLALKAMLGAPM
jgi:solute carrier family 32 (vesicular inhibitory amino acid transporter)